MSAPSDSKPKLQLVDAPLSLREMAFTSIKEAIMTKALEPGVLYNEQRLAEELGMSKTPVHEALLDLSVRGFVTLLPRKGVRINTLTAKDITNLYTYRLVLEGGIIRSLAGKLDDSDIERLRTIHNRCLEASRGDGMVKYLKLERAFHDYLAARTGNGYMISALDNVRDLIDWMGMKALMRTERLFEVNQEHGEVLARIEQKDLAGAAAAMESHVRITLENVLSQQTD